MLAGYARDVVMDRLVLGGDLKMISSPGSRTKPLLGSSMTQLMDILNPNAMSSVGEFCNGFAL